MYSKVNIQNTTDSLLTTLNTLADNYVQQLSEAEQKKLTMKLDKMIISCRLGDDWCSASNFSYSHTYCE
jgi:hypothetical protein